MNSTALSRLAGFVPRPLVEHLLRNPKGEWEGFNPTFDATYLIADITGFTALTEQLATLGRLGAEELSNILNERFSTWIDLLTEQGGLVTQFAGDAIAVVFPRGEQETAGKCALRAAKAAYAMSATLSKFGKIRTGAIQATIQLKFALACGSVTLRVVGHPDRMLWPIFYGSAVNRAAGTLQYAKEDMILVDSEAASLLGRYFESTPGPEGTTRLGAPKGDLKAVVPMEYEDFTGLSEAAQKVLRAGICPFIHPALREEISRESTVSFLGEHRPVTTLFINFDGLDYERDPHVGLKLSLYFDRLQAIVTRFGAMINKIDVNDKGSSFIVLFGAPLVQEQDARLAARFALEVLEITREVNRELTAQFAGAPEETLRVRIGASWGIVFAGAIGGDTRREYTVIGDPVNLAARLMSATQPESILVEENVLRKCGEIFTFDAPFGLKVKGKAAEIKAARLTGLASGGERMVDLARNVSLVGRLAELRLFESAIAKVAKNQGKLFLLNGEPGVGKSRLTQAAIRKALDQGFTGAGADCQKFTRDVPYYPWLELLDGLLQMPLNLSAEERLARLTDVLIEYGQCDFLPLLAGLWGLKVPDTPATSALEGRSRRDKLYELLVDLLKAKSHAAPVILIVEDYQWADPDSQELLQHLCRYIPGMPLLLVLVGRPEAEFQPFRDLKFCREIVLDRLDRAETRELVARLLNLDSVPARPANAIFAVTFGNPFFIEEVVQYLQEEGKVVVVPETGRLKLLDWTKDLKVPDQLSELILSRMDRLGRRTRDILKTASVVGRVFRFDVLNAIQRVARGDELRRELLRLTKDEFALVEDIDPELAYIFKHILTQQVAYDTLLFAHRRRLHGITAEIVERLFRDRLTEYYEFLAYHYSVSDNPTKTLEFLLLSGHKARANWSHAIALGYYDRAEETLCNIIDKAEEVAKPELYAQRYGIIRAREEIYDVRGERTAQLDQLQQMKTLARKTGNPRFGVEVTVREASYSLTISEPARAMTLAKGGLVLAQKIEAIDLEFACLNVLGAAYRTLGQFSESQETLQRFYELAKEQHDMNNMCRAQLALGSLHKARSDAHQALIAYQQALLVAEAYDNRRLRIVALNNLTGIYQEMGRVSDGLETAQQARDLVRKTGFRAGLLVATRNLGNIHLRAGKLAKAARAYNEALVLARDLSDQAEACRLQINLASCAFNLGHLRKAEELFTKASALAREIGYQRGLVTSESNRAQVLFGLGQLTQAKVTFTEVRTEARRLGVREAAGSAALGLARTLARLEQFHSAGEYLREALEAFLEMDSEPWLTEYNLIATEIALLQGEVESANRHLETGTHLVGKSQNPELHRRIELLTAAAHLLAGSDEKQSSALTGLLKAFDSAVEDRAGRVAADLVSWLLRFHPEMFHSRQRTALALKANDVFRTLRLSGRLISE